MACYNIQRVRASCNTALAVQRGDPYCANRFFDLNIRRRTHFRRDGLEPEDLFCWSSEAFAPVQ